MTDDAPEVEFIPIVDNPDITQLERLKGLKGDLKTLLKEYAERKYQNDLLGI